MTIYNKHVRLPRVPDVQIFKIRRRRVCPNTHMTVSLRQHLQWLTLKCITAGHNSSPIATPSRLFLNSTCYMPKIYLHYDGVRGPHHTLVWQGSGSRGAPTTGLSLEQALSDFIRSYYGKHGREAYDGGAIYCFLVTEYHVLC